MALRRMVPTRFFKDPDIMNLKQRDTQLILLGLILAADDEGREVAHTQLLSRELDYSTEVVEQALQDLFANDLIVLYLVGRHRYYSLTRWWQWQTIPPSKRIPSKCPAPPAQESPSDLLRQQQECSLSAANAQEYSAVLPPTRSETSAQVNLSKDKSSKGEEERLPSNIVTFPTAHAPSDGTEEKQLEDTVLTEITRHLSTILKLPMSEGLYRLAAEYRNDPSLSLLGEADAAREWIEHPTRNRKHQQMSLAFFRRWLRREQEESHSRQKQREQQPTGTGGSQARTTSSPVVRHQSLMNLEAQYRQSTNTERENTHHG